MKPTPSALALAVFAHGPLALAQTEPVPGPALADARCTVREPVATALASHADPAAAFAPDGTWFVAIGADTLTLTRYDAATCAPLASTTVPTTLPPTGRFLQVIVASPALVIVTLNGEVFRWTGRDREPVRPMAIHSGECTAWAHGANGRVYAAFSEHVGPDTVRARVVALDGRTGRVVARSPYLPAADLALSWEPAGRTLLGVVPAGRAWRFTTPALRPQPLAIDLRSTQERRLLAATADGFLAGAWDTAHERFTDWSIRHVAPDGTLLLVATGLQPHVARWRAGTALPALARSPHPPDAAMHAVALGADGAVVMFHAGTQTVSVHALP